MKKSLITIVLVLAVVGMGLAQAPATDPQQGAPAPAAQAQPGQAAPQQPQQKKEIKDPAEYNMYMSAVNAQDPNQKIQTLEQFLTQYQNSVVKEDALVLLMASYQQAGNAAKVEETANRLLQVNPNNLRGLVLMSFLRRAAAQSAQNPQQAQQALLEARQFGERGLNALQTWPKPEGMSDQDFQKTKTDMAAVFNASIGLHALQTNEFPVAQQRLSEAVRTSPNDFSVVYPLALAYLNAKPAVDVPGIYYATRAALIAPTPQAQQSLMKFAQRRYAVYHGGEDGWDAIVNTARQNPIMPEGFSIQPGPTPAEQAAKLVQSKPVAQMSFDEFQFIFANGTPQDAQAVWNQIKGKPIAFEAKVIQSSPKQLTLAATYDNITTKNMPDVQLSMTDAIPAKLIPQPGAMAQVTGVPVSYTAEPFMITMEEGKLVVKGGAAAAKAGAKAGAKSTGTRKGTKKP